MLAMDALDGIIFHLRSNDICGNTNPQPLTASATGDIRPVNYWPQIGHKQHSPPIIERRTLSILTEINGRLCQLLTKRLPIIADRDKVIDHAETFRRLLGDNLERLSFEERQAVTHCLIKKVIITGEEVDIHFILPFESSPQAINRQSKEPEGAPCHFYRLRLAHLYNAQVIKDLTVFVLHP